MKRLLLTLVILACALCDLNAQFRDSRTNSFTAGNSNILNEPPGAEENNNISDTLNVATDTLQGFSFKRMFRGFARKDTLQPGYMFLGSVVVPGAAQIYNKQYWKLPIVYGGIGAGIGTGIYANHKWHETGLQKYKTMRTVGYVGAAAVYWGQLLDGVICYKTDMPRPIPAKSTLYSALVPGLGQACNGDWWKIPIWYGGFVACGYFYHTNDIQYKRFRYISNMDRTKPDSGYIGNITASQAEWYRDTYRRYRDYSLLAMILVYALNIIDANVFAYMADFDVSDNIAALEVAPTVINPILPEIQRQIPNQLALGMNVKLNF